MIRSKEEYLSNILKREVYYRGQRRKIAEYPLRIAAEHASRLFEFKEREYYSEDFRDYISAYYKIPRSSEDLKKRHELIYKNTTFSNGIFNIVQAIGSDALFALMITSKKIDRKYGSEYSKRVLDYYNYVAKNDLTIATAQTDVKGNRSKRPSQQEDPDMYLRIKEIKSNGIIISGAKAHTTQSAVCDELIVLPTRAMNEEDKQYAVSFAIPVDTEGLKLIVRPIDEVEGNSSAMISKKDIEIETLTIFEDVFVPWERVFMMGEYEFAGLLANLFALYHRFTAISYRAATMNLYLGTSYLLAKANGIENAMHVRNDILEIIIYKEILKMGALAASYNPVFDEGIAIPNSLYVNISKLYSNMNFNEVIKAIIDIAGGIIATMPSLEDINNPEEKEIILKYMRGAIDGEKRFKLLRIAKELASSSLAGYYLTLMIHAEGSIEASRIAMSREYDMKEAIELVQKILESSD